MMSGHHFIARTEFVVTSPCEVSLSRGFNRLDTSVRPGHVVHPCPTSPGLPRIDKAQVNPMRAYSRLPRLKRRIAWTRGSNLARNVTEVSHRSKREFAISQPLESLKSQKAWP